MIITEQLYKDEIENIIDTLPPIISEIDKRVLAIRLAYLDEYIVINNDLNSFLINTGNYEIYINTCNRYGIVYLGYSSKICKKIKIIKDKKDFDFIEPNEYEDILVLNNIDIPVKYKGFVLNLVDWSDKIKVKKWYESYEDYEDFSDMMENFIRVTSSEDKLDYSVYKKTIDTIRDFNKPILLHRDESFYDNSIVGVLISELTLRYKKNVLIPYSINNIVASKFRRTYGFSEKDTYSTIKSLQNRSKLSVLYTSDLYLFIETGLDIKVKPKYTYILSDDNKVKEVNNHNINLNNIVRATDVLTINTSIDNIKSNLDLLKKYFPDEEVDITRILFERNGSEILLNIDCYTEFTTEGDLIPFNDDYICFNTKLNKKLSGMLLPINCFNLDKSLLDKLLEQYRIDKILSIKNTINEISSSDIKRITKELNNIEISSDINNNTEELKTNMIKYLNMDKDMIDNFIRSIKKYSNTLLILLKFIKYNDYSLIKVLGKNYNREIIKIINREDSTSLVDSFIKLIGKEKLKLIIHYQKKIVLLLLMNTINNLINKIKILNNFDELTHYSLEYLEELILIDYVVPPKFIKEGIDIYSYLKNYPMRYVIKNSKKSALLYETTLFNEFGFPIVSEEINTNIPEYEKFSSKTKLFIIPKYI